MLNSQIAFVLFHEPVCRVQELAVTGITGETIMTGCHLTSPPPTSRCDGDGIKDSSFDAVTCVNNLNDMYNLSTRTQERSEICFIMRNCSSAVQLSHSRVRVFDETIPCGRDFGKLLMDHMPLLCAGDHRNESRL